MGGASVRSMVRQTGKKLLAMLFVSVPQIVLVHEKGTALHSVEWTVLYSVLLKVQEKGLVPEIPLAKASEEAGMEYLQRFLRRSLLAHFV